MSFTSTQLVTSRRMGIYDPFQHISTWEDTFKGESSPNKGALTILQVDARLDNKSEFISHESGGPSSTDQEENKPAEKVQRRLAQNREAARKSRLRKKAYVHQLETSRLKLAQLELELERTRKQGVYTGSAQNERRTLIHNDPESCVLGLSADAVKVSGTERPTAESFWATLPVSYKKSRIGKKKVALKDVQNDRRTLIRKDPESCVLGLSADAIKVSGTERPTAESFWATLPVCYKKPQIGKKKVALRDVQNDRRTLIRNDPESCVLELSANVVKVSGTERLTPECPLNEHVTHAGRNSDSELGKRRVQEASNKKSDFLKLRKYFHNKPELPQQYPEEKERNTSSVPASAPTPTASVTTFSPDRPPVPISLEKPGNGLPAAESNCLQLTSESDVPHSADSKENTDQERKEQFLHLQKPHKHCYEYDQRDYIHLFRHLSPVELNRCAVELEKRSIQLSVEEGKEIKRMKALNIFGKSSLTNNPLQTFPQVQTEE